MTDDKFRPGEPLLGAGVAADACPVAEQNSPELDILVQQIIGRVADKWTMLALEVLEDHGTLRFTRLGELMGGVSQKMLTKTLRQMEQDGLLTRRVFPVIPPRVEYTLTELGVGLGAAFCGVWVWSGSGPKRARSPPCSPAWTFRSASRWCESVSNESQA